MSGGRIAIRGFDYQAIVILDQLFDHFDQHVGDARARPEGTDDLDLISTDSGLEYCRHVQIKKPRETDRGVATKKPWRLSEVADELLPNTLRQLTAASNSRQAWILGDIAQPEVRRLIEAGSEAATQEAGNYWSVVHLMARAAVVGQFPAGQRKSLLSWRFEDPSQIVNDARKQLVTTYGGMLGAANVGGEAVDRYTERVDWIHQHLPGVLARVEILDNYGSEEEVAQRFKDRLQHEYRLSADVVENNLFGNFRSFINDISKRPEGVIDRFGFEAQLRSAWPQMSAATEPPSAPENGILRPDLIDGLVKPGSAAIIEVVGISGSGKTTLAAQAAAALMDHDPTRLPIYVRVREDATFRDAMSGVSFHLLRRGMPELFGLAVASKPADETVIDRLAEICSGLNRPVQLLLDLVDGACNAQFGRDLGRFARALTQGACRLVVFGQQSTFSAMSPIESDSAGVFSINMRGFRWREFVSLVDFHHPGADRTVLHEIFNRVTVGRPAGLYAQLAESLARLPSLDAMLAIASRPPEDMVSAAEQSRFDRLAPGARAAAEQLVCFALPFRRIDAEAAFPNENVGAAIKALVDLGLLRAAAGGLLEMHETVRAGLESGMAPAVRQSAHSALAEWYGGQPDVATQVFHLDKAGRSAEANSLAKETFLRGESWRGLASYVTRKSLVTAREIVVVAARYDAIADFYLLRYILSGYMSEGGVDDLLMDLVTQERSRYFGNSNWARHVVEAILTVNPSRFHELLVFTVTKAANAAEVRQGLAWLLIAARRGRQSPTSEIVGFARSQPEEVQRQLLPVLLRDGGRVAISLAFEIFARPTADEDRRDRDAPWSGVKLTVECREDVVEILAALPTMAANVMLVTRSIGFGSIGSLIWSARHHLRPFCVDILRSNGETVEIRIAAWRVLVFIGHTAFEALVDPLEQVLIPQDYALLGPAFAPTAYDVERYKDVLFNLSEPGSRRQAAVLVLLFLDIDISSLRSRLAEFPADPLAGLWDRLFLLMFAKQPYAAAVPLLKAELASSSTAPLPPKFLVSCIDVVAETMWADVTDFLIEGVQHNDPSVRSASAAGLARRRSQSAAEALRRQIAVETNPQVVPLLVQALTACCPASTNDLLGKLDSSDIVLWQCIIAMRMREEAFAPQLVKLATDSSVHWVIRRAAVWAAGRLPFAAALQQIGPVILAETTPLALDHDENLHVHASISHLMQIGISQLLRGGEEKFISEVASMLEYQWRDLPSWSSLPAPLDAARWLYTSLMRDRTPAGERRLLDAIHTPLLHAAVVRAFRLCNRGEEIESLLASTSSVWLAAKCLKERFAVRDNDPDLCSRLRHILATSPCGSGPLLGGIVIERETGRRNVQTARSASPSNTLTALPSQLPPSQLLDYSSAVRALRGAACTEIDASRPIALTRLDRLEVQRLIALANPANDPQTSVIRFTPAMTFTSKGHVVGQETSTSTGGTTVHERLRAAIAAANRFELPMPWHEERLRWPLVNTYAAQFIASLGAQGDADRLYQALDSKADILLPFLGKLGGVGATEEMLDERLAPALHRHLLLGDDCFFESLCNLSLRISSPAAVRVLSGLLGRWISRIHPTPKAQPDRTHELWRGFMRLTEHPRFREVAGWRKTLEHALGANIWWFDRQNILRVLETDPGSYVTVESRLLREENWAHFRRSEIDCLDEAAERLFEMTR